MHEGNATSPSSSDFNRTDPDNVTTFNYEAYLEFLRQEKGIIFEHRTPLGGGQSGARTAIVVVREGSHFGLRGPYVLKVSNRSASEHERKHHESARANFLLSNHIPEIAYNGSLYHAATGLDGTFYRVAGDSVLTMTTLSDCILKDRYYPLETLRAIADAMLRWSLRTYEVSSDSLEKPEIPILELVREGLGIERVEQLQTNLEPVISDPNRAWINPRIQGGRLRRCGDIRCAQSGALSSRSGSDNRTLSVSDLARSTSR